MTIINKLNKKNKGFLFYTDVMIATILILFTLTFIIFFINNITNTSITNTNNLYLEEKTIFVADSFIKNFDSNNSLLGACAIDIDKKRILSNQLNPTLFNNIKPLNLNDFFIKKIWIQPQNKILFSQNKNSNNCISIKRFVLINGTKTLIYFTGCLI